MLRLLLASLLLCCSTLGIAQTNEILIQGIVFSKTGQPISDADIRLLPQSTVHKTKMDGSFSITVSKSSEEIHLEVSAIGYNSKSILLSKQEAKDLVITLHEEGEQIQEVQVVGQQREQLTAIGQSLTKEQIQESKGKVLAEVFADLAGVSLLSSGHSVLKPVINGLHSNRILMLNQGLKLEGQQWGLEHAPEIDPFSADQFELIKGAQAVRYGADALAGVLVAKSSDLNSEKFSGVADLLGYSNGKGVSGNLQLQAGISGIPGLAWKIQGSAKKLGNSKAADYYLGNTAVEELNFSTQIQYKQEKQFWDLFYSRFQTDLGVFYGAHVGTIEDILARIEHGRPLENYGFSYEIKAPRQQVSHQLARLKFRRALGNSIQLEAQYGWQQNHRQEFDMRRVLSDDVPMSDMLLTTQSLEVLLKRNGQTIGLQAGTQVNNNKPGTGTTPIIPNFDQWSFGLFGMHQKNWSNWTAELGWRYDYRHFDAAGYRYKYSDNGESIPKAYKLEDQRQFHNFSGSLGMAYSIDSAWKVKSSLGLAWRAPTANELYSDGLHHGAGIYEIGNLNLKAEQGLKWVNSISKKTENFNFQADAYMQYIRNYIYAMPNPDSVRQTIRGTFPVFSYNQHNALFYGVDLNLQWKFLPSWQYQINAGLVRAKNLDLKNYLPYIPADQFTNSLQWSYGQNKVGYLKLSHQFVAKQTRYDAGSDFAAPPSAYHLFHFYMQQTLPLRSHQVNLGLRIENLLNSSYKDYMDRFRYYAHRQGRNIVLSLHYNF